MSYDNLQVGLKNGMKIALIMMCLIENDTVEYEEEIIPFQFPVPFNS